jgi:hypothetical protein
LRVHSDKSFVVHILEMLVTDPVTSSSGSKTGLSDAIRTSFSGDAPLTKKAKNFAKARPWTSVAFVGMAAAALLSTFRRR